MKAVEKTFRDKPVVAARHATAWRKWLEKNHLTQSCVWLIIYHQSSTTPSVYYDEAVEQALCFGWIDSVAYKRDGESSYQYFAPRKPKSRWSKLNKERVDKLSSLGLIAPKGQELIDLAKSTGTWDALNDIDNLIVPEDLQKRFFRNKKALENFEAFPPSSKRIILEWISAAKRPETRSKRIEETVTLAARNIRANHYERK